MLTYTDAYVKQCREYCGNQADEFRGLPRDLCGECERGMYAMYVLIWVYLYSIYS